MKFPSSELLRVFCTALSSLVLCANASAHDLQRLAAGTVFRDCADCPAMVVIPPGRFSMGSPAGEAGRFADEGPQHAVAIRRAYAAGRYEVTRGQFAAFAQATGYAAAGCHEWNGGYWEKNDALSWRNPGFAQSDDDPVVCVSWQDARAYADWLARRSGKRYRLLTEAQWEYAARAGSAASRPWGEHAAAACGHGNVADASARSGVSGASSWTTHECDDGKAHTAPVGSYQPNAFGLYDMIGNAWEWTEDCWNAGYADAPANGAARLSGDCAQRVLRGGSWFNTPQSARSASRYRSPVDFRFNCYGFRVART